jgi:hypothetical protein
MEIALSALPLTDPFGANCADSIDELAAPVTLRPNLKLANGGPQGRAAGKKLRQLDK